MKPARWCTACHPDGWQCEQPALHAGPHRGGDYEWTGTTRWRETQNRVFSLWEDGVTHAGAIAEMTGLHVDTVRRHLRKLRAERLVD